MSFLPTEDSVPSVSLAISYFQSPNVDVSVKSAYFDPIYPVVPLSDDSPIHFRFSSNENYYSDMRNSILELKVKVFKLDGNTVTDSDKVSYDDGGIMNTLFQKIQVLVNDRLASSGNSLSAYTSFASYTLLTPNSTKKSRGSNSGFNGKEDGTLDAKLTVLATKTLHLAARPSHDFFQLNQFIPPGLKIDIKFFPSLPRFVFRKLEKAAPDVTLTISEAVLHIRKVNIASSLALAVEKCLVKRFENETKKLMASKESSPHIVVGTPDSISCMIGQGALDNENIKLIVLDKAGERLSRPRDFCNPIKFYLGIITHGFEKPHYAQQRALFPCVEEKDVKSEAKSGSGRITAASIYALNQIEIQDGSCQVVVMTPSCQREKQIRSLIPGFGFYMHAKCLVTRLENETKKLKTYNESSPHIVVGTPDIFCIIGQGALDNENIKLLSRTRDFRNPIKRTELPEVLPKWLTKQENTLVDRDAEPLPDDIPTVEKLIEEHNQLMEETVAPTPKLDRVCKPKQQPKLSTTRKPSRKSMNLQCHRVTEFYVNPLEEDCLLAVVLHFGCTCFFDALNTFADRRLRKIYSSPYNPQCNGASENKVKILKKILSHSCGNLTQVDWDEKIPRIMLSMNSSLNTFRKFSSFTIVHGFSGKSLLDLQFNKPTNLNYFDGYDSYVTRLIQNICEIHQTCLNEIKIQRSKQAIQYNKDSKETLIASGDIVYCRDTTSVGRKSTKYCFRGPYVVLSEVHKNVFYLASLNPGLKVGESCCPSDGLREFLEYKENIIDPEPDINFHQTYGIEGPIVPGVYYQWNSIFV
ncbi:hypothetical protein QYM36_001911, partial [Artemia franciscana]